MIDSLIGACEALVSAVSGKGKSPTSRISRVGMPNGFFLNDLLWFGDGASKKTAISRGFMVEPGEISAFSVTQLNDLHERLRILLGILGEEFALQVQWSIDSDYRHELEACRPSLKRSSNGSQRIGSIFDLRQTPCADIPAWGPVYKGKPRRWSHCYVSAILSSRSVVGEYQPHT